MKATDAPQFWDHVAPLLAAGKVDQGTLMGGACLRVRGEFLAMANFKGPGMVVKLTKARVAELIGTGVGEPFSPNGRVFREWVLIPSYDPALWDALLEEGRQLIAR